ncbi:MAG: DUF3721 domain-containing protein [Cyanobacteriota bacterium]|nr:DUF3721 domain-containing protein [Cyanobacteriota bacterium]
METLYAYPSKAETLLRAQELGCRDVHAMGSLWMPCATHPVAPANPQGSPDPP